jgi:uncharacterized membrane protein YdjX (TVP38/TMEM64 family)
MKNKVRSFFERNKKLFRSSALLVLLVVSVSCITLLLLAAFDVVRFEDGMRFNSELFMSFKSAWYGWLVFILLQTVLSMLLCAIPAAAMALTLLSMTIYTEPWQAFVISFIGAMLASGALYIIGRFGGYKLCEKFLGEKDCDRALSLLRNKGTVYFPLFMALPTFPDEALTMIAGTIKMSLAWFIPSVIVGRGIGIVTITFGLSAIPFDKFTTPLHWIVFILLCIFATIGVLWLANKLNKIMEKRRENN